MTLPSFIFLMAKSSFQTPFPVSVVSIDQHDRTVGDESATRFAVRSHSFQSTFSGSLVSSVGPDTMLVSTGSSVSADDTTSSCR